MKRENTGLDEGLLEVCTRAGQINRDNLVRLLSDNADTAFGRFYDFASLHSVEDYRRSVPLLDYASLQPWLERMERGEEKVLTAYPVAGMLRSSGTEGKVKRIPITFTALERYADHIEWYKNRAHREAGGKRLFVNGFRVGLMEEKEEYLLSEIYYRYLFCNGYLSFEEFAGGKETLFGQNGRDILYAKVWVGFAQEDITALESIFLYDQLLFFQYMQKHWRSVLKGMRRKQIPERIGLPQETKRKLLETPVSEERLAYVEAACRSGFDGIAARLWPRLALSSGIGGEAFEAEDGSLRGFLGKTSVYYFAYVASECHMGVAPGPEQARYVMLPQSAFYEYLPWPQKEGEESEKTLLPGQLEKGKLYEPVLSTFSGLYRCRMGDVVRSAGFLGESPVVEFVLRKNLFLNVAGEKLSVFQAERAVLQMSRRCCLPVRSYCVGQLAWESPACYGAVFAVGRQERKTEEAEDGRQEQGKPEAQEKRTAARLDRALAAQSPDYEDLRKLRCLGRPQALLLEPEEYAAFLEELGLTGGHGKPRHAAGAIPEEVWKKWKDISSGRRKR